MWSVASRLWCTWGTQTRSTGHARVNVLVLERRRGPQQAAWRIAALFVRPCRYGAFDVITRPLEWVRVSSRAKASRYHSMHRRRPEPPGILQRDMNSTHAPANAGRSVAIVPAMVGSKSAVGDRLYDMSVTSRADRDVRVRVDPEPDDEHFVLNNTKRSASRPRCFRASSSAPCGRPGACCTVGISTYTRPAAVGPGSGCSCTCAQYR